jgi:integrase/recombinase XerD
MEMIRVYVTTRRGRPGLHLCWRAGGRVNYQSCRTDDAADAEIQRRQHEEQLRRGESDPYAQHRDRPLLEHAADYYQYQRASGTSAKQAGQVQFRIERILTEAGITHIRDLTIAKVKAAVAGMTRIPHKRSTPKEQRTKLSAQSRNFYLAAIRQFVRWLQIDRRIPDNPLLGLQGENVAVDRRHDRRALTDDELGKLLHAARNSADVIEGMTGEERARLYLLAVSTGLRRGEIASLRKSSFHLDSHSPTATLEAAYSKHRRKDVLQLHPHLVPHLRLWLADLPPNERLFPGLAGRKTFEMMKRDLKAAGVPYRNADGKYADFHALRHTFITRAWTTGTTPDVVRALARHCDINLTLRYTHTTQAAQADAIKKMPALPGRIG